VKLLIISDTHGNSAYVDQIITYLRETPINVTIHLGDDYQDAQPIIDAGFPVVRVPGTWTSEYQNPMIDNRRFDVFEGWRFFLTHTPDVHYNDLPEDSDPQAVLDNQQVDILCHGHTHRPEIVTQNGVVVLNPGHLKSPKDRGYWATFAEVDVTPTQLDIVIRDFDTRGVYTANRFKK